MTSDMRKAGETVDFDERVQAGGSAEIAELKARLTDAEQQLAAQNAVLNDLTERLGAAFADVRRLKDQIQDRPAENRAGSGAA
jgi:chromosome segregation ATPase